MRIDQEQLSRALHDMAEREVLTPAPTRQVMDRARQAAQGRIRPVRLRRPAPRRLGWSVAVTGLVAAAAAAVLLVPSATRPPGSHGGSVAAAPTGQQILLAAAEQAGRAPATTKRYWVVRETMSVRFLVNGGYEVTSRRVQEDWSAVHSGDASWVGLWDRGARPSTPADEKAWRADGSPTQMRAGPIRLTTAGEEPWVTEITSGGNDYFGESEVSLAEIRALRADPDVLKKWAVKRIVRQSTMPTDTDVYFTAAVTLLTSTPASPAVRAAAFQLLASLPGVRSGGEVRDDLGRPGTLISVDSGDRHSEIIVDAAAGQILAKKGTGEPTNKCAGPNSPADCAGDVTGVMDSVYEVGWSDGPPKPPSTR